MKKSTKILIAVGVIIIAVAAVIYLTNSSKDETTV